MIPRTTSAGGIRERIAQAAHAAREHALSSVHGGFVVSVILRGVGAMLALTVNILLARFLGVAEYGHYMSLLSAALLLGGLAVRGADKVLTRELASGEKTARPVLTRWAVKRVARSAVLAVVAYLAWVIVREHHLQSSAFIISSVLSGALLIGLSAFCMLQAGALNGLGASLRSQALPLVVHNAGLLAILGALLWSLCGPNDARQALWLQVGGYLLTLIVGWLWLHTLATEPAVNADESYALIANAAVINRWSVSSTHFMLVTVASMLVNRFDVILVSALAGNETAGVYAAAARLAQVALMFALAVNIVLSPRFASAWMRGDNAAVRRLLRSGFAFTVPIAIIEVLIATVFAPEIVALFGPAYSSSATSFVWVTLAYALWAVAAPGYAMLSMTGSEKIVAALSWIVLAVNAIAILMLVPLEGAAGAGMAMSIGFGLTLPFLLVSSRRKILRAGTASNQ